MDSSDGYALMLPPPERRYEWSRVWVADREDSGDVVALARVLEETDCVECREDMVVSHVEVLSQWAELAKGLLAETAKRPDPRRDDMARVLMFFAADLGRALLEDSIGAKLDDEVAVTAMTAITEAVAASTCASQSFSKQLASTL